MDAQAVLALDDAPFQDAWRALSSEERSAIGERGFTRFRALTSYIDVGADRLRREQGNNGHEHVEIVPGVGSVEIPDHEHEPIWARHYGEIGADPDGHDGASAKSRRNIIDWNELAHADPPAFTWLLDHWLSWHPTLLSGRGGIGKSLLAQQIATGLATGRPLWGAQGAAGGADDIKVLYWACEDDRDEIWRRQDRICRALGIGFGALTNLHIDARCGMENAIFATEYGRPAWTPLLSELQQQVNDYHADVLILDNLSQIYGGSENDRHHVTTFINGLIGLRSASVGASERPFCPILLGHVSKAIGSEYSGSTAWENAVRMRWYLAEKLPGEAGAHQTEPDTEASDTRFLCKRKANYSVHDYLQLDVSGGLFKLAEGFEPGGPQDEGMAGLRALRARTVVHGAVRKLEGMGITCQEKPGTGYLVTKILEMKMAEGLTKVELRNAMNGLLKDGRLVVSIVGKKANRMDRYGIKALD